MVVSFSYFAILKFCRASIRWRCCKYDLVMHLKIWQKILLIVSLPVLFEIVFVVTFVTLLLRTEQLADQFESSKRALLRYHAAEDSLLAGLLNISTIETTSQYTFSEEFDRLEEGLNKYQQSVASTFGIRPEIKEAFDQVPEMFDHSAELIANVKVIFQSPPEERREKMQSLETQALTLMMEAKPLSDRVNSAESHMQKNARIELDDMNKKVIAVTLLGLAFNITFALASAFLAFRNIRKRLTIIEQNAQRVAVGRELNAPFLQQDEVGELDAALHKAAGLIMDARKKEFAILEQSVDVICSLDRRLRIVHIGDSVRKAWKYEADELLGRSLLTLVPEAERTRVTTLLSDGTKSEKEFEFETELNTGNNLVKDISWKTNWSQEDKTFYVVAHDVTERRALARQKQQLISVAGHDLRTPLTSVSSTFALITEGARGEISQNAHKELTKASGSVERLMELVRDLLDMERLDQGKMVLEFNCISALDVCTTAVDTLSTLAAKLGIKVVPPWQDALIIGDQRRLVQVMLNFLSNAIKFSPRGGTVTVEVRGGDEFVELSVADQGPGIPAEDKDMVFEKFHQSKAVKSNAPIKSTGLGLAIAKVLTEGHNGSIGVESEVGVGTRFFIRIPAFKDTADGASSSEDNLL